MGSHKHSIKPEVKHRIKTKTSSHYPLGERRTKYRSPERQAKLYDYLSNPNKRGLVKPSTYYRLKNNVTSRRRRNNFDLQYYRAEDRGKDLSRLLKIRNYLNSRENKGKGLVSDVTRYDLDNKIKRLQRTARAARDPRHYHRNNNVERLIRIRKYLDKPGKEHLVSDYTRDNRNLRIRKLQESMYGGSSKPVGSRKSKVSRSPREKYYDLETGKVIYRKVKKSTEDKDWGTL